MTSAEQKDAVDAYVKAASAKSDLERTDLAKEKTGVFTGAYALNPAFDPGDDRARIPIWVADYVLASYGTGAIMAVPGQDQRDWDFATEYDLPIVPVVRAKGAPVPPADERPEACVPGDGVACNSPAWAGLPTAAAKASQSGRPG